MDTAATLRQILPLQPPVTAAISPLSNIDTPYRDLVEQIPAITYIASLEKPGTLIYLSPQIEQLGYPMTHWLGDPWGLLKYVLTDDLAITIEAYAHTYEHHAPLRCEYRLLDSEGRTHWFVDTAHVVRDPSGESLYLQGLLIDIGKDKVTEQELCFYREHLEELVQQRTEQLAQQCAALSAANTHLDQTLVELQQTNLALQASEQRFRLLVESTGEGIFGLDVKGRCTFANRAALQMLGYTEAEVLDQEIQALICQSDADQSSTQTKPWRLRSILSKPRSCRSAATLQHKTGYSFPVECSYYPIEVAGRVHGVVMMFWNVTEAHALIEKLAYQASHDPLTGLINRSEFEQRLSRVLTSAREEHSEHVVSYLDLDHFKTVNDSLGHAAGDELLRELAKLLTSKLRQRDYLARLGGDEFALLLEHTTLEQAKQIAEELCECVRNFGFKCNGDHFSISVSIGLSSLTHSDRNIASVMHNADSACYMAKKQGRNQIHIYESKPKKHLKLVANNK